MSLTEDRDKGSEYSLMKVDAGCTPKLSRRTSVANECGKRIVEILTKRTPGLSHRPSSSSSWLHVVKKSRGTSKQVVENRRKLCNLQLPFDAEPFSKKHPACHSSADSMPMVNCDNQIQTKSPYHENKTPSNAPLMVCRCTTLMYLIFVLKICCFDS